MFDDIFNNDFFKEEEEEELYPDFFYKWDEAVKSGKNPGYYEQEELTDIIDIYIANNDIGRAKHAIDYAMNIYSEDEELIYEILLLLNDYERWNELLYICEKYKEEAYIYGDGHKLAALLHLGMEDEAFLYFRKLKVKYAKDKEELSIIYQSMGEALHDVDLFDSALALVREGLELFGENVDLYWIQIQCYLSLDEKDKVIALAERIQKLKPLDAESWHRQGIIFEEIEDYEKSIDALENAQSLGYESPNNLLHLIHAYGNNNNYTKALEKVKEFINLYPDNYLINLIAAKLCSHIEDWKEALKYIDEAIKLMPDVDSLYIYKSKFLMNMDDLKKAKLALIEGIGATDDPGGELKKELGRLDDLFLGSR
ncbi:MAG: tetratricopeptide repeat protein [Candidatus Symbiothrix sp.]|jgi:tetratricopeptide (TPR) repeat protein|nr:tetratricopeptide repeat protein [Candidatus Symbiothrix sp.]